MLRIPRQKFSKPVKPITRTFADRDIFIKEQLKEEKGAVIYGATAMNKNMKWGILHRPTKDYDVMVKDPLSAAKRMEKKLDKEWGGDYFYTKPAIYEDTIKVMSRGIRQDDPSDDYAVVDFTKKREAIKADRHGGLFYATLDKREADARKTLNKPEYGFRKEKDEGDLARIRIERRLRQ